MRHLLHCFYIQVLLLFSATMSSAVFPQGPSGIDCSDVRAFIQKLNEAAMDRVIPSDLDISTVAHRINTMLATIRQMTNQHKPEDYTGCRYGSKAHTAWIKDVEEKWDDIAKTLQIGESITLPYKIRDIRRYFLHSFGNPMRIDYGTGHEMQFVLFLKTLYDTGIVEDRDLPEVALTVMSSYFQLVQHLIDRYNLEPAGSKGAWGLDHFQFMPFLLGSAQLVSNDNILPSQVVDPATVLEQTDKYIFLQTVDYIKRKIKRVTLEIASPMLYSICTSCNWRKINQGLMEMYTNDVAHLVRIGQNC